MTEDATLLTKAARGDRGAMATLYDRHAPSVFAYAMRLVSERSSAEDVVQETFLALLASRNYDPRRPFAAWLLVLARNEAIDVLRRRKRRGEVGLEAEALDAMPARGERDPDAKDMVERALREIPVEYREALWLCDGMGMSYKEASEVMTCDEGTVGSRLSRGRKLMKEYFARQGHAV